MVSNYIAIPPVTMEHNSDIDVTGKFFFVNKINFLVTLGQRIKFTIVGILKGRRSQQS